MRASGLILVSIIVATSCSADGGGPTAEPTRSLEAPAQQAELAPSGCPVQDQAFCRIAVDVAIALSGGEGDSLLSLSRSTRIDCAEIAREYFPACETSSVLKGYAISAADLLVEVLEREAFADQIGAVLAGVDPTYSDASGGGSAQVLGVGTCGPDVPGRRTYHVAWTAAVSQAGALAERLLSSFEITLEDDEWRIALWYLDTLERWGAEQTDPMTQSFCEAGLHPWLA